MPHPARRHRAPPPRFVARNLAFRKREDRRFRPLLVIAAVPIGGKGHGLLEIKDRFHTSCSALSQQSFDGPRLIEPVPPRTRAPADAAGQLPCIASSKSPTE